MRDTVKVIILLSLAFMMVSFEDTYSEMIPFASLIAVMCMGISLQKTEKPLLPDYLQNLISYGLERKSYYLY